MKPKTIGKILVDLAMTALLMLLMAFELVGRSAHEWIGAGMFLLFLLHHVLNWKWSKNLFRGKYSPFRILQTVSAGLVLCSMLGSLVSAIPLSREVFAFLPVSGGLGWGRALHMLSAYWGFIFLSLHLGIHWGIILSMAGKGLQRPSRARRVILRVVGACIALYGLYAFFNRGLPGYLFLQTPFAFFDFEEPLVFFFLDYLAIMGLFIFVGHSIAVGIRNTGKNANGKIRKTF